MDRRRSFYGDYLRGRDREREDITHEISSAFVDDADRIIRSGNNQRIQLIESLDREEMKKHERIRYLKDKEREYEDRLLERRRQLDQKEEQLLHMDARLAESEKILQDMIAEKKNRQARLEDLQGIKEDMNEDIRRRRDEIQRLDHQAGRAKADLLSTKNQLRQLREEMAVLAEAERTYREELDHHRYELTQLKTAQAAQIDSLRVLNRDLQYARHEYGDLDSEVRRLDDIDKRARRELEYRKARIEELMGLENQYTRELENLASARAEYSYTVDRLAVMEERQRNEILGLERRHSRLMNPAPLPPPAPLGLPVGPAYASLGPSTSLATSSLAPTVIGATRPMITGIPTTPFRTAPIH